MQTVLEVGRDGIPFLFEKPRNHPSAFLTVAKSSHHLISRFETIPLLF
jgi:hypothetical protein